MAPDEVDLIGSVAVSGQLDTLVSASPPDWEQMLADLQASKAVQEQDEQLAAHRATAPLRPAPWWWRVRNWLRMLRHGELFVPVVARLARLIPGVTVCYGTLRGELYKADEHVRYDLGVMGYHLVTTAGKTYLAACFTNANEPENLKYHAFGTGTIAPAAGDTALVTELTTQYNPDNTRPTGSQSASTNTYTTAATVTPDSGGTIALTEWMLMSQAATGGGIGLDRQVYSPINLVGGSGDSLTTTYTFTIN